MRKGIKIRLYTISYDCWSHTIFEDRHVADCATHFGEEFLGNIQKFHIVVSTLLFKRMQSGIKLKTDSRKPKFLLSFFN